MFPFRGSDEFELPVEERIASSCAGGFFLIKLLVMHACLLSTM